MSLLYPILSRSITLTGFTVIPTNVNSFCSFTQTTNHFFFVPALEVERATAVVDFQVVGYVDSENPWEKIKGAIAKPDAKTVALNMITVLTKYNGCALSLKKQHLPT